MAATDHSFPKKEKLCSQKVIGKLFSSGRSFVKYPLKVVFMSLEKPGNAPVQVLVTVSKKRFKRAYRRNIIKRRIREAYRLNKHLIYSRLEESSVTLAIAFIYLPAEIVSFTEIEKGVTDSLRQIKKLMNMQQEQ